MVENANLKIINLKLWGAEADSSHLLSWNHEMYLFTDKMDTPNNIVLWQHYKNVTHNHPELRSCHNLPHRLS